LHNKDIVGKEVVASDGLSVGKVTNLFVTRDGWTISSLEVSLSDATGLTSDRFSGVVEMIRATPASAGDGMVTIPVDQIQGVLDKVTLKLPKAQLPGIPPTKPSDEPRTVETVPSP
jgi:sporulation protein YlmC with PRC-barrel domain